MENSAFDFLNPEFDLEKSEFEVKNLYIFNNFQVKNI